MKAELTKTGTLVLTPATGAAGGAESFALKCWLDKQTGPIVDLEIAGVYPVPEPKAPPPRLTITGGGQALPEVSLPAPTYEIRTEAPYPNCTETLRQAGQPYPRTCQECGLGPCKKLRVDPKAPTLGLEAA